MHKIYNVGHVSGVITIVWKQAHSSYIRRPDTFNGTEDCFRLPTIHSSNDNCWASLRQRRLNAASSAAAKKKKWSAGNRRHHEMTSCGYGTHVKAVDQSAKVALYMSIWKREVKRTLKIDQRLQQQRVWPTSEKVNICGQWSGPEVWVCDLLEQRIRHRSYMCRTLNINE